MNKEYLGDAVYVKVDPYGGIILTTEDGIKATNTIYLEGCVIKALEIFIQRMRKENDD